MTTMIWIQEIKFVVYKMHGSMKLYLNLTKYHIMNKMFQEHKKHLDSRGTSTTIANKLRKYSKNAKTTN